MEHINFGKSPSLHPKAKVLRMETIKARRELLHARDEIADLKADILDLHRNLTRANEACNESEKTAIRFATANDQYRIVLKRIRECGTVEQVCDLLDALDVLSGGTL